MLSILDYAQISQDSCGGVEHYKEINYSTTSVNNLHGIYRISAEQLDATLLTNFRGALYIQFHHDYPVCAVIAFACPFLQANNYTQEILTWHTTALNSDWQNDAPEYFYQAVNFTYCVFCFLQENFVQLFSPEKLRFTGHSVGGALAQLIALNYFPARAIIFNSPVCRKIVPADLLNNWHLIHNVNARYDFINKIGGIPIGHVYDIAIPDQEQQAQNIFAHLDAAEPLNSDHVSTMMTPIKIVRQEMWGDLYISVTEFAPTPSQPKILAGNNPHLPIALGKLPAVIDAQHNLNNMIQALYNGGIGIGNKLLYTSK